MNGNFLDVGKFNLAQACGLSLSQPDLPNMVKTSARFTSFARGRIVGKAEEGARQEKIRKQVLKKDGTRASVRAIQGVASVFTGTLAVDVFVVFV